MYPKRAVPGHTANQPNNTILTEETYNLKFVKNGGGSYINGKGKEADGQNFMVYPVYKDINSDPEDYKFYVHSIKI